MEKRTKLLDISCGEYVEFVRDDQITFTLYVEQSYVYKTLRFYYQTPRKEALELIMNRWETFDKCVSGQFEWVYND